jgi:hypothetical protein
MHPKRRRKLTTLLRPIKIFSRTLENFLFFKIDMPIKANFIVSHSDKNKLV